MIRLCSVRRSINKLGALLFIVLSFVSRVLAGKLLAAVAASFVGLPWSSFFRGCGRLSAVLFHGGSFAAAADAGGVGAGAEPSACSGPVATVVSNADGRLSVRGCPYCFLDAGLRRRGLLRRSAGGDGGRAFCFTLGHGSVPSAATSVPSAWPSGVRSVGAAAKVSGSGACPADGLSWLSAAACACPGYGCGTG